MAKALPLFVVDPEGRLAENAPLMLHTRLEEMYQYAHCVADPALVTELHNMRIAAKRLRYTMEIVVGCYPGKEFDKLTNSVKKIQEQIGDIHDADVRIPAVERFMLQHVRKSPRMREGLQSLIVAQAGERARRYETFVAYWNRLQANQFKRRFLQFLILGETSTLKGMDNNNE